MSRGLVRTVLAALLLILGAGSVVHSQRGYGRGYGGGYIEPNTPYNGRFTFARIRYTQGYRLAWGVDYPRMERNFLVVLNDLSKLRLNKDVSNVYTLDDPGLKKHTVAWLTEPGYWMPTRAEAQGLREWLQRGGFLIIDDFFFAQQWSVFESSMQQVLPGVRFFRLTKSHPIFNTFFTITNLEEMHHPATPAAVAEYYAVYEDNDPNRRMLAVISFNNDIGDYMEWSGDGWYPVNFSNNAYKYATNFLIYGLTH
ncbi:MAG: DUF4159 domain-containing protein [Gemmatimonadaceae bacterium]|nr:DUF4159 domain-containing protein [Gemmatimonadaceae bacterium]